MSTKEALAIETTTAASAAERAGKTLNLKKDQVTYLAERLKKGNTFLVTRPGGVMPAWGGESTAKRVIQATGITLERVQKTYKGWRGDQPILAHVTATTGEVRILQAWHWRTQEDELNGKRALLELMSEGKIPSNQEERDRLMAEINPPKVVESPKAPVESPKELAAAIGEMMIAWNKIEKAALAAFPGASKEQIYEITKGAMDHALNMRRGQ